MAQNLSCGGALSDSAQKTHTKMHKMISTVHITFLQCMIEVESKRLVAP